MATELSGLMRDHRPPPRPIERQNCMFERCRFSGREVNLDGSHPRVLCEEHERGIVEALARPHTYRVTWGLSSAEKVAKDQSVLDELLVAFGEPDSEELSRLEDASYRQWEESDFEGPRPEPSDRESAWMWIVMLRANIELTTVHDPVVRVRVMTR